MSAGECWWVKLQHKYTVLMFEACLSWPGQDTNFRCSEHWSSGPLGAGASLGPAWALDCSSVPRLDPVKKVTRSQDPQSASPPPVTSIVQSLCQCVSCKYLVVLILHVCLSVPPFYSAERSLSSALS